MKFADEVIEEATKLGLDALNPSKNMEFNFDKIMEQAINTVLERRKECRSMVAFHVCKKHPHNCEYFVSLKGENQATQVTNKCDNCIESELYVHTSKRLEEIGEKFLEESKLYLQKSKECKGKCTCGVNLMTH